MFKAAELNYNTHNIIADHKNMEYFSTIKILSYHQVRWFKVLSQFNLIICFHLGHLGSKAKAITQREDLYLKEESAAYNFVNPQSLYHVFIHSQLVMSLWATALVSLFLQVLWQLLVTKTNSITKINSKESISWESQKNSISVVATTRHSRTNDLTTSKALQWAIK